MEAPGGLQVGRGLSLGRAQLPHSRSLLCPGHTLLPPLCLPTYNDLLTGGLGAGAARLLPQALLDAGLDVT